MSNPDTKMSIADPKKHNSVDVKSKITANLEHVVTAKVGRLELRLNSAITTTTNRITELRSKLETEKTAVATWAKKSFVNAKELTKVPESLGLKLAFSAVSVNLSREESTASWSLVNKTSQHNQSTLNTYSEEIPAEQTEKYFAVADELASTERDLVALRRELSQLSSKERIMRGAAAEAVLKQQGMGDLLDQFDDESILQLPANVAALLPPVTGTEKAVEQKA